MTPITVEIFIAGDIDTARAVCRRFCKDVGLCVTINETEYIYTGGSEVGVVVGLRNYPRFPSNESELFNTAMVLANELKAKLCQWGFMVQSNKRVEWVSDKPNTNK